MQESFLRMRKLSILYKHIECIDSAYRKAIEIITKKFVQQAVAPQYAFAPIDWFILALA